MSSWSSSVAALIAGLLMLAPAASGAVAAERTLSPGASFVFKLGGNPSTGYRWRLNAGASENPAIVKVEDLGYGEGKSSGKKLIGAPAPYRFRITGVSPGFAKLHFEYVQPWVGKPIRTEDLGVRVD